ncbi:MULTISPECIES: hypothetical protein [Nocardiaceae]|uniref:hypothetical protein n=1 Tax=Nocardiaceae TaxID=85025 RepID=UPI00050C82F2|nr:MULTISPECIES: hypothetical protein [Rhodococcus]OZC43698.1 hypothetical protein CH289_26200 [Rhodococcus sp. RS1C4]OZC71062.1 hypothetical protein CH276_00965 [Rhodococcus sp. 06-470-2]OZC86705.1 hypothetical protein CH274_01610 [Rhodococcus sp. 06-418-5]OZC90147.1 hypothetical protein CH282_03935 [Rhodococcus sp. 06-418-1B]OZC94628.1 hypothetical protein CH254_00950 [Rhodococcus sp. 06-412-2C]
MSTTDRKKRPSLADQFDKPAPRGSGLANIFPRNGTGSLARPAAVEPRSTDVAAERAVDEPHVQAPDVTSAPDAPVAPAPEPPTEVATSASPSGGSTAATEDVATTPETGADTATAEPLAAIVGDEDVRPIAVYVPATVKEAWKTRSQREKKSYGEIVEDAFAAHTPETLVRLFAPRAVESPRGGMPRLARPKVASGGVEVRPHLWVAQTRWIDEQVEASPLIPSRSALIAAVVEDYLIS